MKRSSYSRRTFLAGMGLGPALLPVLSTDFVKAGCLAKPPKRMVAIVWTNGVLEWPGTGPDFTLPPSMKGLAPHKTDIIPIRGIKLQNLKDTPNPNKADNAGHGATPALLTGKRYAELRPFVERGGGPSIDQFISAGLAKQGVMTARGALNLSAAWEGYVATWKDAAKQASPDNDPFRVFTDLFAGKTNMSDPNYPKLLAGRKSLLDYVKRDIEAFKGRVGTDNASRIDAHLVSIRELEKNMNSAGADIAKGCSPPVVAKMSTGADNMNNVYKAHMDITVAALAADVTRCVTIQLGNEGSGHIIPTWLGFSKTGDNSSGVGDKAGWHAMAHAGGADKLKMDTWLFDQLGYLIGKLKDEKENGSSVLSNTVVLAANHMATGGGHSTDNVPFVLAGSCGGYFKTGQSVSRTISQTAILKEMILAMGVDPAGFFEPEYNLDFPELRMKA